MATSKLKDICVIELQYINVLTIVANLDLALRLPGNNGDTSEMGRAIGSYLLNLLDHHGIEIPNDVHRVYEKTFRSLIMQI
ncbi:hypothetical protein LCGC14_2074390 [marine sediment metagenome]|uniref:Uncharacterized protein n=1 Tax=marine sediment metagenome TaxID=412755 RepID=A0A0F9EHB0_9ZZZZ